MFHATRFRRRDVYRLFNTREGAFLPCKRKEQYLRVTKRHAHERAPLLCERDYGFTSTGLRQTAQHAQTVAPSRSYIFRLLRQDNDWCSQGCTVFDCLHMTPWCWNTKHVSQSVSVRLKLEFGAGIFCCIKHPTPQGALCKLRKKEFLHACFTSYNSTLGENTDL